MQKLQIKDNYDVVIIGGGISGLTSAALYSRFGLSVCLLEMDARPGGYVAGFRRKDFRFDSAIHWLNQCGPKGYVTQVFKAIGTDYPKAEIQKKIRRYRGGDVDYLITNTPDDFMKTLIQDFPKDEKGIRKFFKHAKRIAKSFENYNKISRTMDTMNLFEKAIRGMKMLNFALPFIPHISYHGDEGVKKGLSKYFTEPKLIQLFAAEGDLLSCLIPISWAYIEDFQTPPQGGSQTYAEWLLHVIKEYKNDVCFKCRVTNVNVENGVTTGVNFDHRGAQYLVKANYVIAACDVETLYERMLPEGTVGSKMINNLRNAELYASAVTLNIGLNCTSESLGFGEEMIYLANQDPTLKRKQHGDGDPLTSGIHMLAASARDKSLAPVGKGTLTVFIPGFIDQYDNWKVEYDETGKLVRGQAYRDLKQEVADTLIRRIEKELRIELQDKIEYLDIATPVTHERYTGNRGGTMMGARPGKANMKAKVAHYKTPVKNLYLSGHWAELGGGVPVAVRAAMNTTMLVLQKENKKAYKVLANYIDGKIDDKQLDESQYTLPYLNNWVCEMTPAQKKQERE
ncbi:MAG: NAD(P)/FAD-dependent oxidoreductase [Crocinitomicaceae bacterium]|nr:NAD(P)/FAD-dependent oxidoreductase [Crocinitomicaceae bacterium]